MKIFNKKALEEKLKGDFEKIKTLEDLKDFLFKLLPEMIKADFEVTKYVLDVLEQTKRILEGFEDGK